MKKTGWLVFSFIGMIRKIVRLFVCSNVTLFAYTHWTSKTEVRYVFFISHF